MGEGIVSNIRFDNVITRMTLDIRRETNSPLIFDFSSRGSLQAGGNYHLNDADPVVVETILPPVYGYDQKATVCFTIDGKEYPYEFHRDHEWEAGMKYTYTLKMTENYNSPVNMEQVDIDVEYWSRYGKTDQIILNPNPEDYEFTIGRIIRNMAMTVIKMKVKYLVHSTILGVAHQKEKCGLYL